MAIGTNVNSPSVEGRRHIRLPELRTIRHFAPIVGVVLILVGFWSFVFLHVALPARVSLMALVFSVPFILSAWALWYFTDERD